MMTWKKTKSTIQLKLLVILAYFFGLIIAGMFFQGIYLTIIGDKIQGSVGIIIGIFSYATCFMTYITLSAKEEIKKRNIK